MKFKVATKITDLFDTNGITYTVYDRIKPNPTIQNVQDGVAFCKDAKTDIIVAVGGGAAMDTAKAIAIILTNPEFADVRSLKGLRLRRTSACRLLPFRRRAARQLKLRLTMSLQTLKSIVNLSAVILMIFPS